MLENSAESITVPRQAGIFAMLMSSATPLPSVLITYRRLSA
jgi:hypothetical protein